MDRPSALRHSEDLTVTPGTDQPGADQPEGGQPVRKEARIPAQEPGLWSIIAPVKVGIGAAMGLSLLGAVSWVASIMLFWPIATELVRDDPDTGRTWTLFGIALGLVVCAFVFRVTSFLVSHLSAYRLEVILRGELSDHLAKVPLGYVVSTGSGALKKLLLDDVRALHAFVADSTPLFAKSVATPLLCLVAMFVIDWRMALVSLALFPLAFVGMRLAFRDYDVARRTVDEANEHISAVIIEYVQGMHVVRTFDDGSGSLRRYTEALHRATEVVKAWTARSQVGGHIARALLVALPTAVVVLAAGTVFYRAGTLDLPELLMFVVLAPTVAESIIPIVWLQQFILNANAAVKRIGALRAVPALPQAQEGASPRDASVQLDAVTFAYPDREDNALDGVSVTVPAGSVTALVGPSGAGKSTVAQLIVRFWDVDAGAVRIGGVDVRDLTADTLMGHVSFVFQSPFLLNDTVAANIRLGRPGATDEEVIAAATAAQAHEFIVADLPDGYDSMVGERGVAVSGGERQRITIARAILQDNPIVVLDEATAFADPDNEAKIHTALAQLAQGKTLIVVAHRLSTIQDADQIVVLDGGRVCETGTHEDLVNRDGRYRRLWDSFEAAQGWGLRIRDRAGDVPSGEISC
ncbi:MAG: ABC transporter ATP-binding protein/permease [Micrococcales bacterium]|nr:MAG: ABC transporter ATP-binding protein/permease [Micrococcales bacterium]